MNIDCENANCIYKHEDIHGDLYCDFYGYLDDIDLDDGDWYEGCRYKKISECEYFKEK